MGRYCLVDQNTVVRPPGKIYKECVPSSIGAGRVLMLETGHSPSIPSESQTLFISDGTVSSRRHKSALASRSAMDVSSYVPRMPRRRQGSADICKGKFVIIKDLAVIRPGTVLPEATVVPSYTIWEGNPGERSGIDPGFLGDGD